MPRTTAANEQIRAATTANIIETAIELFATNGYAPTSMRKIAQAAGISVGLTYHYFPSKEALLTTIFEHCTQLMSKTFDQMYPAQEEQPSPAERLAGLIRAIFNAVREDHPFWALFYALRAQPAVRSIFGPDELKLLDNMRRMFAFEFRSAGRPRPDLDALMLHNLIEGTIQHYLQEPASFPLDQLVEEMVADLVKKVTSDQVDGRSVGQ